MSGRVARTLRWPLLLAATALTWLPIVWLSSLVVPDAPGAALSSAEFLPSVSSEVPPESAPWRQVLLPDDWRIRRPGVREGWYRLRFDPGELVTHGAVHLPTVAMNAEVFLNGDPIGEGGRLEDPPVRNWHRPLLFRFPAADLHEGANTLHLRVRSDFVDSGFLPLVYVGQDHAMAAAYLRAAFIRQTLVWILIVLRLGLAGFTAAIWTLWRKESYYGWFAVCAFTWVLADANIVIVDPPLPTYVWYWLFNVAIVWWGISSVHLVLNFIGVSRPRAEAMLVRLAIAGSIVLGALALGGSRYFVPLGINLWLALVFLASCYLFRGVVTRLLQHPDAIELNVVFVVSLSVIGCVLADLLMQLGLRPRGGLSVPAYGSFVAVAGMGWVLVRRFVGALRESRALAVTLEMRVAEKHAELERSYRQIAESDRERTLSEERERILGDVREGLGGQLVSTLALAERPETTSGELQSAVRSALDDLRLVIDSLDPLDGEILPPIAVLRSRLQPRFDAAGIALHWQVEDLPAIAGFGPHKLLVLLRVVQEMFSAALHAPGARDLVVRTGSGLAANGMTAAVIEIELGAAVRVDFVRLQDRVRELGAELEHGASEGPRVWIRISIPTREGAIP